jgi:hypothetical protein
VAYHPTFGDGYLEGEYDDLGIGLADDLTYADEEQEIGALWRDDAALLEDNLGDDLEDDPIAILSAGNDADALAYIYEDALDAPQLEEWAGVEAGEYEDAGTIWTRRLGLTAQIVGLILLLGISAVSAFILSKSVLPSSPDPLPLSSVDTSPKQNGYVIAPPAAAGSPTPVAVGGSVGVWVDTSTPGTSATVNAYARVTKDGQPVTGIAVKLDADYSGATTTYGPVTTDSYGIAAFTLSFSGVPAFRPIYLTATTKLANGTELTGQTFFVPR